MNRIEHLKRILRKEHPDLYDSIKINVEKVYNNEHYRNSNLSDKFFHRYEPPFKYKVSIIFIGKRTLYNDLSFYIDCIWCNSNEVIGTYRYTVDMTMEHTFEFEFY